MDVEKELQRLLLNQRESERSRASYNRELALYEAISSGDMERLNYIWKEQDIKNQKDKPQHGVLSDNDLSNRKYHIVILTALASRFCIEAGMDINVSYSLSDIYIRMIDHCKTTSEVDDLAYKIITDYCQRMRESAKKNVVSKHVVLAIDYIRSNVQENLSVEHIADALSLNPSYLSKLFKQEMGKTISQYIRTQKIQIACNMLRHLDESSLNISNYLGFSSQSHFIQVFKKEVGVTPEDYRKKHYHSSWISEEQEQK
ncbi:MAG: AraC family transcriptional regulator [Saccharofermentans sp.]|nr:AraC family transcriptional regulator [Saccharofermentans sp.]